MYLLVADETNTRPSLDVRFFIYGGIFFPIEKLMKLHDEVLVIRKRYGFRPDDELKFNTRTRPEHVTPDQHAAAKKEVVQVCTEIGCKFLAHVIHHGIIKNQDLDQQVEWAANRVIGRFHTFLRQSGDDGICILDNLPTRKQFRYLSEKFCRGLVLSSGREVPLPRIKLYACTCVNASHANSAMDVVLGTFRYCVNNPSNQRAAREMMASVVELMWHRKTSDVYYIGERGLIISPPFRKLRSDYPTFLSDYEGLIENINKLLSESES